MELFFLEQAPKIYFKCKFNKTAKNPTSLWETRQQALLKIGLPLLLTTKQ